MTRAWIMALVTLGLLSGPAWAQDPSSTVANVLSRFDAEPSVLEVQKAASRYAKVDPDAYSTWRAMSAWANLMPEKVSGEYWFLSRDETDVRTSVTVTDTVAADEHERYRLTAEWDLTRLIFNPDSLTAARETSRLVERREDLLTTVNKLYFSRRQLQAEAVLNPASDARKALKTEMRIAGLTADLDALTGGWFSDRVTAGARSGEGAKGLTPAPLPSAVRR